MKDIIKIVHLPSVVQSEFKAAVRNFFWLKNIRNQYLSKYITSQCSKLSPYFCPIHNGKLIILYIFYIIIIINIGDYVCS